METLRHREAVFQCDRFVSDREDKRMDSAQRFSNRVENYIKFRTGYPGALIETLRKECGLTELSTIADIGSGTGILTELFLRNGNHVAGVEPNRDMREAAERLLARYSRFQSVAGRAEATELADHSVDFVTAAQAFHWFDRDRARGEFRRILKSGGWVVLVWNERDAQSTPFLVAYEGLLDRYGTDYKEVDHRRVDGKSLADFYGSWGYGSKVFSNRQELDYEGLRGRLLSSSYVPPAGDPGYEPMLAELSRIFEAYAVKGRVIVHYRTLLYWGGME
jgi:SAM-dependent methyltransferase